MLACSLLLPLFASPSALAPQQTGDPAETLHCILEFSTDLGVDDRWYYTPGAYQVWVPSAERVYRKQYFGIYLFFAQYGESSEGDADILYDIHITRPDASIFYEATDLSGYRGPTGGGGPLLLSQEGVFACFEPEDPFGEYLVTVRVRDLISGSSIAVSHTVSLVEYVEGQGFESWEEARTFLHGEATVMPVERVIPGFLLMVPGPDWSSGSSDRGFFRAVFEANHWLLRQLLDLYPEQDEPTRRAILWLLSRSSFEDDCSDVLELDPELWQAVRSDQYDPLVDPIRGRADINELWGMYIGGRRFEPFMRLCLALSPETGVVAEETLLVTVEGEQVEVPLINVVARVVEELLAGSSAWDPISREFGIFLAAHEGLPASLREDLARIFEE